jgi:Uma2 family endonuclease
MVSNAANVTISYLDEKSYANVMRALEKPRHSYRYGELRLPATYTGVSWEAYKQFLKALGDKHVRHFYDQGTLEIMSPLKSHEWIKKLIGRFVAMMAWDQKISIQSVGSMTVTSDLMERGFEPDESYYIGNESKVRGKMQFEPDVDPPPDLVIEIDVTRKSKKKLSLLGSMKVPEVWLHDGKVLKFLIRSRTGEYKQKTNSKAFPFLTPEDFVRFIEQYGEMSEHDLVTGFVKWTRKRRKEWQT